MGARVLGQGFSGLGLRERGFGKRVLPAGFQEKALEIGAWRLLPADRRFVIRLLA